MFENTKKKYSSVYPMLETSGDKEAYQKFMRAALKKFGVESPADLSPEEKKKFFDYVDANWKGDNEKPEPGDKKEAYEAGTDEYTQHCKDMTPGQAEIKQNEDNERNLDEKAVSQQQQKLMGLAYAVKKGDIDAPSPEVQKIADSMSLEELKKMAEGKHKDLPVKKEEKCPHCEGKGCEKCDGTGELPDEAEGGEMPDTHTPGIHKEKLDARRKMFREKIKKLAYEKAKKMVKSGKMEEKKEEKKKNKVIIDPNVEENKGYNFVKNYKEKQAVVEYIKENMPTSAWGFEIAGTYNKLSSDQALDMDGPATVEDIARALKVSPMRVQEIMDQMMRMGEITKVGDTFTYGKTEVAT